VFLLPETTIPNFKDSGEEDLYLHNNIKILSSIYESDFYNHFIVNLKNNADRLIIFNAKNISPKLFEEITWVEKNTWPNDLYASSKTIEKRLEINSSNTLLAYSMKHSRVVSFISMIDVAAIDMMEEKPWEYFNKISTSNYQTNKSQLCNNKYIISISSSPIAERGTGTKLLEYAIKLCAIEQKKHLIYAIRVSNYHKISHAITIYKYYDGLMKGDFHDDLFKMAINAGGIPRGIIKDYYLDPYSLNYGIRIIHNV